MRPVTHTSEATPNPSAATPLAPLDTQDHDEVRCEEGDRHGELGFSLNEVLIAVAIIGILSVVVIGEMLNAIEKARLAACLANMVTIRESVWENCDGGMAFPERDQLWNQIWGGVGPKGYWYAIDNDDPNRGHGNDLDGFDEQNPGNAPRRDRNIYFVLACEHDHGMLADYVFLEDDGSPQIAMRGDRKPIWYKFYRKDGAPGGPPGGGNGGGGNNGGGNGGGNA
jgi:prepilin-type N-terminal cleavage/methylation domain-containing protein